MILQIFRKENFAHILCSTYFLQLYLGLTPSLATAFFNGVPSFASIFFPLAVNTVMCRLLFDLCMAALFCDGRKALVPTRIIAHRKAVLKQKLDIFFVNVYSTRWDGIYCSATPVLFSIVWCSTHYLMRHLTLNFMRFIAKT